MPSASGTAVWVRVGVEIGNFPQARSVDSDFVQFGFELIPIIHSNLCSINKQFIKKLLKIPRGFFSVV